MALQRVGPDLPHQLFEQVLNRAYVRERKARSKISEPRFVRELISTATIRGLNQAAAAAYNTSLGKIHFRGGFLHAKPYARFNAAWSSGSTWPAGNKNCSRELADALFVLYEAEPMPGRRQHRVVRRSACMLMFKRDHSSWPSTPTFEPGVDPLPLKRGNSDKEQFYLYNKWPSFCLEEGSLKTPNFSYHFDLTGTILHDIGKYALVWDGKPKERWEMWRSPGLPLPTSWIYAPPKPDFAIHGGMLSNESGSLGYLLERLIERVAGHGRDFDPSTSTWGGARSPMGWNELMVFLLGYPSVGLLGHLSSGHYYGKKNSRDINPAAMQLMGYTGDMLEHAAMELGTLHQVTHDLGRSSRFELGEWPDRLLQWNGYPRPDKGIGFVKKGRYGRDDGSNDRLPVLVATVNYLTPLDMRPDGHATW